MRKKVYVNTIFLIIVFFSGFVYGAIPAEERAALIALYNSTDGDNWTKNSGWKTPPLDTDGFAMPGTEGTWYGITVSAHHVSGIFMLSNRLNGSLPSELRNFTKLENFRLDDNNLIGAIPKGLGNLTDLIEINLANNQLSGNIPVELGGLINLEYLLLYSNRLTGDIPDELSNLTKLANLDLEMNQLTVGNFPLWILDFENLWNLNLGDCGLTGNIPAEIGRLTNLITLVLWNNQLTGNIPPGIGNLTYLNYLGLRDNKLSGNIPTTLGNLNNLQILYLYNNRLNGGIPSELGNLIKLELFQIAHNKLRGLIPVSLINLTELSSPNVDIGYNCLYTNDPELRAWLNNVDPDWETNQNECGFFLTVRSTPDNGVLITVSPNDKYGQGNGSTEFFRTYDIDTVVTLTAPASHNGKNFDKWLIDGAENTSQTIQVTMDKNHTAKAVYQAVTYILTVQSFPDPGVGITISPSDNNGNGDGNTNFTRTYDPGTGVTLTAPSSLSGNDFIKWTVDSIDYNDRIIQLTMDSDYTAAVYYASPPEISVNRDSLNLGYITGSNNLPVESFTISNSGGGTLNWDVSTEMQRINLNPVSGANYGEVNVSMDPVGLIPGKFRGVIYVSDSLASNSPVEVKINLWVKAQSEYSPPFGEFSTPVDNSTVRSSVPVTGWALGDTGIESIKIYREEGKSLVYIGNAVIVEGARPDVEAAYPDYPMNYKAGWGYMMLTNFLPNGGNGTFKIHAITTDKEGRTESLGVKTIYVDNDNAVKPFGAIDTPTQGGTASGSNYVNWGWVLTSQPNSIPTDGSTINAYVDGVNLGHPTYNIYRGDIANLFPAYANSNGAAGYFYLDTTAYENGVHTIQWTATDNAGNTDGIGSRYFTIQNTGSTSNQRSLVNSQWSLGNEKLNSIPINHFEPVILKKGYQQSAKVKEIYPGEDGIINVSIRELERLEIRLYHDSSEIHGYMIVGDQLKTLPIGSFMDIKSGTFCWQPGLGFVGEYRFVFIEKKSNGEVKKKNVFVKILPKFGKSKNVTKK